MAIRGYTLQRGGGCEMDGHTLLLIAIFSRAYKDTASRSPDLRIHAQDWLSDPIVREVALAIDLNLPKTAALATDPNQTDTGETQ